LKIWQNLNFGKLPSQIRIRSWRKLRGDSEWVMLYTVSPKPFVFSSPVQKHRLAIGSVWVWNLVSDTELGT
jgi:WD40 repeat protein